MSSSLDFDQLELDPGPAAPKEITTEEFLMELEPEAATVAVTEAFAAMMQKVEPDPAIDQVSGARLDGPFYDAVPEGGRCQEFGMQLGDRIIPCGDVAVGVVHHPKDRRDYLMCLPHLDHNVRNRGGVLKVEPAAVAAAPVADVALSLMQILPADFQLPSLIKFCPDPALRRAADEAAKYALSLEVHGLEGVQRADTALTAVRTTIKAIELTFKDPRELANQLHKQITGTLSEWCGPGKAALETVGGRVAREQRRLQAEEQERRRKAQEDADRQERERARQEAAAAEKAQAPAPVVQEMRRQAETATAPPVPVQTPAPKLSGSSVIGAWKPRFKGTSGAPEPNPTIEEMTIEQKQRFMDLLRAIVDGEHQLVGVQPDWKYWGARARADKSTLDAPGIEAYEDLGLRGKSSRSK